MQRKQASKRNRNWLNATAQSQHDFTYHCHPPYSSVVRSFTCHNLLRMVPYNRSSSLHRLIVDWFQFLRHLSFLEIHLFTLTHFIHLLLPPAFLAGLYYPQRSPAMSDPFEYACRSAVKMRWQCRQGPHFLHRDTHLHFPVSYALTANCVWRHLQTRFHRKAQRVSLIATQTYKVIRLYNPWLFNLLEIMDRSGC